MSPAKKMQIFRLQNVQTPDLSILERLYLLRRLQPRHRNVQKRLIKTSKIHLCDSGLAAALSGISETTWMTDRGQFGHLLESFII